ncbi:MAG: hypothetical protein OQK94_11710 [Gammaproteobacteria bacterium]|nr:hypothetical protein [Gammaproteobacteria bacterium]MCW8839964.1 hypothetical protein [Gammaproteobacteria bacterium]MCW8959329.1 hypothetical protein [Gammaproteobacteria bacterium]MCW8993776.1 hypothetical protein [Gammaproteobacteria bacterium]
MSVFIPAFEVCLTDAVYPHPDNFKLNSGQWVTCDGAKGRIIDPEKMSVLWRHASEPFRNYNLRFKKALMLHRGIKKCRSTLRVISNAKRQISMSLPEAETPVLDRAKTSVHRELNLLKRRLEVLTSRRDLLSHLVDDGSQAMRKTNTILLDSTEREIYQINQRMRGNDVSASH